MTLTLKQTIRVLLVLYFVISQLTGCAGLAARSRVDQFSTTHKAYKWALESGNYRGAVKFLDKSVSRQPEDLKRYANIKVSQYTITGAEVSNDRRSIEQDVELQYFLLDQNIVKTMTDHQKWRYRETADAWLLQTGLPEFPK